MANFIDELHDDYCDCDDKTCASIPKMSESDAIEMVVQYLMHDEVKDYYHTKQSERGKHIYIALANLDRRNQKK